MRIALINVTGTEDGRRPSCLGVLETAKSVPRARTYPHTIIAARTSHVARQAEACAGPKIRTSAGTGLRIRGVERGGTSGPGLGMPLCEVRVQSFPLADLDGDICFPRRGEERLFGLLCAASLGCPATGCPPVTVCTVQRGADQVHHHGVVHIRLYGQPRGMGRGVQGHQLVAVGRGREEGRGGVVEEVSVAHGTRPQLEEGGVEHPVPVPAGQLHPQGTLSHSPYTLPLRDRLQLDFVPLAL